MGMPERKIVTTVVPAHPSNYSEGRKTSVSAIILHTSVGSLNSAANWFAVDHKPSGKSVSSAHYVIGLDGEVIQCVSEFDTAYHAGTIDRPSNSYIKSMVKKGFNPNDFTIGIEHEDKGNPAKIKRTDEQLKASIELCYKICKGYKIVPSKETIIPHREIRASKSCPGNLPVDLIIAGVVKKFAEDKL